ncbi:hypothetical protein ANTQUA_LOCUS2177 [Anthophora quadrimaculata]
MSFNKSYILKTLQLILVCVLIGLHYHSFNFGSRNSAMITMGAFGGYLVILAGIFFGILLGSALERRMDLFFSVVGFVLFILAGALILDDFINIGYKSSFRDTGIAKGCISLAEGILFLIDAVLTYRGSS